MLKSECKALLENQEALIIERDDLREDLHEMRVAHSKVERELELVQHQQEQDNLDRNREHDRPVEEDGVERYKQVRNVSSQ